MKNTRIAEIFDNKVTDFGPIEEKERGRDKQGNTETHTDWKKEEEREIKGTLVKSLLVRYMI